MLVARVEILSHGMLNSSQLINATHFPSSKDKNQHTPHGLLPESDYLRILCPTGARVCAIKCIVIYEHRRKQCGLTARRSNIRFFETLSNFQNID